MSLTRPKATRCCRRELSVSSRLSKRNKGALVGDEELALCTRETIHGWVNRELHVRLSVPQDRRSLLERARRRCRVRRRLLRRRDRWWTRYPRRHDGCTWSSPSKQGPHSITSRPIHGLDRVHGPRAARGARAWRVERTRQLCLRYTCYSRLLSCDSLLRSALARPCTSSTRMAGPAPVQRCTDEALAGDEAC